MRITPLIGSTVLIVISAYASKVSAYWMDKNAILPFPNTPKNCIKLLIRILGMWIAQVVSRSL